MEKTISVCGFNCSKCPAFKDNISGEQDRKKVDEGWKKYHRTKGWIYKQPYCKGCFANIEIEPLWRGCHIRKCAIQNDIKNCGICADYPCNRLMQLMNHMINLAERTREIGTEEDYHKFAEPYLGKDNLDKIHEEALNQKLIKESPQIIDAVEFPSNLKLLSEINLKEIDRNNYEAGLKVVYNVLKSIVTLKSKTKGEREYERKKVKELIKLLYIIGRYGELFKNKNNTFIEIPFDVLKTNLRMGKYAIRTRLEKLVSHGIKFDFIDSDSKIKLSFKDEIEAKPASYVLKAYIEFLLNRSSERKAYSLFSKADMSQYMI